MRKLIILLAFLMALPPCQSCTRRLVILHVNDTHSHFDPLRSGELAGHGGVMERAAVIDSIRRAEGEDNVLLLHAGDWNQGSSYNPEFKGELEVQTINLLRYDAITLGNHEFDNGIDDLTRRVKLLSCPVVCANLDLGGFELGSYVKPWTIVRKGGRRIGVIGLECELKGNISKSTLKLLKQTDPVEAVNSYSTMLKEAQGCDKVIVLSHQGYDRDSANVAGFRDVDVVIGGHTHTFMDDLLWLKDSEGKDVAVITDGCWGLEIGKLEMK